LKIVKKGLGKNAKKKSGTKKEKGEGGGAHEKRGKRKKITLTQKKAWERDRKRPGVFGGVIKSQKNRWEVKFRTSG